MNKINQLGLKSKYPELNGFPEVYTKSKGVYTWSDKEKLLDMSYMGIGCNMLGFSNKEVNKQVKSCIDKGNNSTLNHYLESTLAMMLISIHPWANFARYARTGNEAILIALEIAKAHKKRFKVVTCGYHGWHTKNRNYKSFDPNIESFDKVIEKENPTVLIMELIRHERPKREFLSHVQKICSERNIIIILDEITSGFRFRCGGAHLDYDFIPDMCVFGKAMSNGYAMSAVIGNDVMRSADKTFISSTYFTDGIGTVAAIETIFQLAKKDYNYIRLCGKLMKKIWAKYSKKYELVLKWNEVDELCKIYLDSEEKKIYNRIMLMNGILATDQFYPSFAHKKKHFDVFDKACDMAFQEIKLYIEGI